MSLSLHRRDLLSPCLTVSELVGDFAVAIVVAWRCIYRNSADHSLTPTSCPSPLLHVQPPHLLLQFSDLSIPTLNNFIRPHLLPPKVKQLISEHRAEEDPQEGASEGLVGFETLWGLDRQADCVSVLVLV